METQQISADAKTGQDRSDQRQQLLAGAAGITSAVLTAAGIAIIPKSPATGARNIAAYFVQHHGALQVSSFLRGAGMLFFLLFLAGLVSMLRRHAARQGIGAGIVAAGSATAAVTLLSLALRFALTGDAVNLQDATVAQLARDMAEDTAAFAVFAQVAVMGLASWALLTGRRSARLTGRVSLVVTALLFAGSASIAAGSSHIADPGWLTLTLWTAAVSLLMIRDNPARPTTIAGQAQGGVR